MGLRDRILNYGQVATATVATTATLDTRELRSVATVATVNVARDKKVETVTTEKVDWVKPCPISAGQLFNELDRGGFFCASCQELPAGAKPLRMVHSKKALKSTAKITRSAKSAMKQVTCQVYEQTGVLMSTSPEHCREWQGAYCAGCALMTIH